MKFDFVLGQWERGGQESASALSDTRVSENFQ